MRTDWHNHPSEIDRIVQPMRKSSRANDPDSTQRSHPVRGFFIICAAIVTLVGTTATLAILNARDNAFQEDLRDATNLAVALAEQTARYVQTVDLSVLEVRSWATEPDRRSRAGFDTRMRSAEIHQRLVERRANILGAQAIVLVDADGAVLNTSGPGSAPGVNVTDRSYFTYLKDHDDAGLVIGSPAKGHITGVLSLFFARRVNSPDGTFLGLVVGVVDATYLSNFYRAISDRLQGSVTLLLRDGTVLLRYPDPSSVVGRKIPPEGEWYSRVAAGGGSYRTPGYLDGVASVVVARPLNDYALVVDVTTPEAVILGPWLRQATYVAVSAVFVALGFIALALVIARQFLRQQRQNDSLRKAAARLRERKQKLRTFAEMSADWFWEQGADLRFLHDSNIPLTSLSTDVGKTRWDFADPTMNPDRWALHQADLAARRPFRDFRWERIQIDGKRRYMSTSGDPIFDDAGIFQGYRGTGRDITADVEAAEELRVAKERAETANRAKSAFLANMSHELRTPLSAIMGFSELIRDHRADRTGANHVEWANAIHHGGRHLLDIVNNVLDLAKIEAGQWELADNRVDLSAIVRSCLAVIGPQAEEKGLQIDCALGPKAAVLRADGRAVKHIVLNILSNAVKFTPDHGAIAIHVEYASGGDVVLVVSDTGIGIDPVALTRLCEPFVQADTSATRIHGGTGLGLAISRKLMLLHSGALTIESVVGRGTTVRAVFRASRVLTTQPAAAFAQAM
jgi:signal transduction histidine kinase